MGCDIHAYVEINEFDRWWGVTGNISLGRNYQMFGLLSNGVRGYSGGLEPKGLPIDVGYQAQADSRIRINKDITEDGYYEGGYCVTLKTAQDWEKRLGCKIHYLTDGEPYTVDDPDWHSHTWLTLEELEKAINEYKEITNSQAGIGLYIAVKDMMKSMQSNGIESRLVIWFDN